MAAKRSRKESTMSRSSLMTALALLLSTTAASAAKAPAKVVVHEGDSLQAAIDAASPGTTIVVQPGIYHGEGARRAIPTPKEAIHRVGGAGVNRPATFQQRATKTPAIGVPPADSTDPADPELPPCGMLNEQLHGFTLTGFTVQGFP